MKRVIADKWSATIALEVAAPQLAQYGTIQLNATRGASGELISCDVALSEFIEAFGDATGLVVIDPEGTEAVERLADLVAVSGGHRGRVAKSAETSAMQAALREFANPTPPKPADLVGSLIHEYAVERGDLSEQYARDQLRDKILAVVEGLGIEGGRS